MPRGQRLIPSFRRSSVLAITRVEQRSFGLPNARCKKVLCHRVNQTQTIKGEMLRCVLPSTINEDETAAEFKDGVLKIAIPKMNDAQPHKIKISK
jgi:hypothetical protein